MCVAVLLFALLASRVLPGNPDDQLRYAGLALQLLGVGTVAYLLRDKRTTFNRKGFLDLLKEWVSARPQFRPKSITLQVSGAAHATSSGAGRLSIWRRAPADATLEKRLETLEANLEQLHEDHSEVTSGLRKASARLADELSAEKRTREEADRATNDKLEKFGAEGIHVEATGLVWLVAGIVLATIPSELAAMSQNLLNR